MKPEQDEGHGGSEASSRKRAASDLREDEKHRKKVKGENSKTETDGKKLEKKVKDENIKTDGKKKKKSSIPLQETQISSSGSVGADSGSCRPDEEHPGEQNKSKSSKNKRHRDVGELAANSLDTKPKRSKDEKREGEEVGSTGSENARREKKEDKHQSGNKKSANEKKRKKENVEKEISKKKVKKEGERDEKSQKSKKDIKVEEDKKWKWWEEGHSSDGRKWSFLEHRGPLFPPLYEPLPSNVSFSYNGQPVKLSLPAEEVATFYAKMLDHEYTTKTVFQENFFSDWKEEMTSDERALIRKLSKCDFTEIHKYFLEKSEEKKAMTKEQKQVLKEEANRLTEEYGFCILDGHREKIGNFRVEPPGLFRGRGEHPKMGKLKKRIQPEDISINCSKGSKIPLAPDGHRWKKVQHDDGVTWLASWVENVQGNIKYVMLNPSSKLKGEKDWQKYEVARKLKEKVETIRTCYRNDWRNKEMKTRQRGVALYFIDKLALRAGNEKEESETADTVGCCSLRVEHIRLLPLLDGQENVVEFDFLGKDSIRYYNRVPVESRVFKNLKLFMENKGPEDDLFDRINTGYLNKYLNEAMPGLTAKVFRTFNASTTLQEQLGKLTSAEMSMQEKLLSYNRANRAVAILCNHQRAAPKTFEKSMQLLQDKIAQKEQQLEEAKKELKAAKKEHKRDPTDKSRRLVEKKEAAVMRLEEQLKKLLLQMTDKEENKVIALGTSKLNYLDPRISVAWCRKYDVPIEKIYNKTQRDKFAWAIDMTDDSFTF